MPWKPDAETTVAIRSAKHLKVRFIQQSPRKLEKVQESIIYRKSLLEKSPDELVALVIKQRIEAALEFQHSVEQSLEQLSGISSDFNASATKRRKFSI